MEHPPYHILDYSLDVFWCLALLFSAWITRATEIKRKIVFIGLAILLIPVRFFTLFLMRLGFPSVVELLALLYLASVSLMMMWRAIRRKSVPDLKKENTA